MEQTEIIYNHLCIDASGVVFSNYMLLPTLLVIIFMLLVPTVFSC